MAPFGIRLDHCLVGELVVSPDQFVCAVVLVGDRHRAVPGDGGYVPDVVVGVFVGIVAAVPVGGQQRLEMVDFPNGVVKRIVPLAPGAINCPLDTRDRISSQAFDRRQEAVHSFLHTSQPWSCILIQQVEKKRYPTNILHCFPFPPKCL